jgi:hypothetical protein
MLSVLLLLSLTPIVRPVRWRFHSISHSITVVMQSTPFFSPWIVTVAHYIPMIAVRTYSL